MLLVFFIYIGCQIRTGTCNISQPALWESIYHSSSSYTYASEINNKRSIFRLTLLATGILATSTKILSLKKELKNKIKFHIHQRKKFIKTFKGKFIFIEVQIRRYVLSSQI